MEKLRVFIFGRLQTDGIVDVATDRSQEIQKLLDILVFVEGEQCQKSRLD